MLGLLCAQGQINGPAVDGGMLAPLTPSTTSLCILDPGISFALGSSARSRDMNIVKSKMRTCPQWFAYLREQLHLCPSPEWHGPGHLAQWLLAACSFECVATLPAGVHGVQLVRMSACSVLRIPTFNPWPGTSGVH